ncbi:MAG: sigma 54-interacting transcriptional regulator [Deltaproteobacteria bacterium]|nr:sigma 54-interacting transcriptional regulator [Deltaproteobacteria bacterium]
MSAEDRNKTHLETTSLSDDELAQIRALKKAKSRQRRVSILITYRDGVRWVPLTEGQSVIIGRSAPADVPLRDDSLSRQHACIELLNGEVWIEDLQSTNGTWVNGEKIERSKIEAGDDLALGAVLASLHIRGSYDDKQIGLDSHDHFSLVLSAEVVRAQTYSRKLSLLMIKCVKKEECHIGHWFPAVRDLLRPFDGMALYSTDTVEILLPEANQEQATQLAQKIVAANEFLQAGLAIFPDHASSAEELQAVTRTALQAAKADQPVSLAALTSRAGLSQDETTTDDNLIVRSAAMKEIFTTIDKLASSVIPVLINGQTGSGKEIIARAIHTNGKRKNKPMRCVNCAGIPAQLVESTLFGHEKGAFTGANQKAVGVFESANGGTVLLDEIGELPAAAQAALLRVLETKCFTRVGSNTEIEVDVRILAATHKNLEAMVESGDFRQDLLYRLNAMTIDIPPLRERVEEIEPLALSFLKQANQANEPGQRMQYSRHRRKSPRAA